MGAELAKEAAAQMPQGRDVVRMVTSKLRERGMTLVGYCKMTGVSYSSLRVGFISARTLAQFQKDGLV